MPESQRPYREHPNTIYKREKLRLSADEYSQDPDQKPIYTCRMIVAQAKREGNWIYDPKSREWYSPDEFNKAYDAIKVGHEALFARVLIKDPKEGIEAGYKVIVKMQEKWNSLVQRVLAWQPGDADAEPPQRA